jgi:hypothetical protein
MTSVELPRDVVADLLRSAWIVESARAIVYADWRLAQERFEASRARASERAETLRTALDNLGVVSDRTLVDAHARWIHRCARGPDEPLADLFMGRLADWVDAHALHYVGAGAERMRVLSGEERAALTWPSALPPPPPFEPLGPPAGARRDDVELRIGILGDLHVGSANADDLAAAAVADLNAAHPDVVVQLGDLTDRGERSEFEDAARLLADLEAPLLTTMGNHDAYSMSEGQLLGRARFRDFFGREPEGLLVEVSGYRIVVLDSVDHGISPFAPFDLVTGSFLEGSGGAVVRGALSEAQHELLAEVAAPGAPPAFVFLHHPPQPFTGFPPVIFGLRDADSGRLHATSDSGNVWGVFAGHTHRNHRGTGFDGVPSQEVAAPRDFPCGYALIDVAEGGYEYRFVQVSDQQVLQPAYERAGAFHRRYALGEARERGWCWHK